MNTSENRKTKISHLSVKRTFIQLFKNNCKIQLYTFITIHVKPKTQFLKRFSFKNSL